MKLEDSDPLSWLAIVRVFDTEDWMSVLGLLFCMLILLIISSLVSASEIAFFSLDKNQLERIDGGHPKKAQVIRHLLSEPDRLLATILITNNTVNIALVLVSTILIEKLTIFGGPEWLYVGIQMIFVTALILLFGEIVPKVYATQKSERVALFMTSFLAFFNRVFTLPAYFLLKISKGFDKKIKAERRGLSVDELTEVHEIVQDSTNKQELMMLDGILEIGTMEVRQVMRSRTDVFAIGLGQMNFAELRAVILDMGYSRIPIYDGSLDQIKGILYIKDLLAYLDQGDDFDWESLVRPAYFVPESKLLDDLLTEFKERKVHVAIVVDEYGGTKGLVTMEDVIEEIVGDIKDEFDDDDVEYTDLGDGKFLFEGKIQLADLYRIVDLRGDEFDQVKGESETIAGVILQILGKFPRKGDVIRYENFVFTVEAVDKKRIVRIKLERLDA